MGGPEGMSRPYLASTSNASTSQRCCSRMMGDVRDAVGIVVHPDRPAALTRLVPGGF